MISTVSVQSVLYDNSARDIERLARGLAATVRSTTRHDPSVSVDIVFGDSSSAPLLDGGAVHTTEELLRRHGAAGFRYEFFSANLGSAGGNNALAKLGNSEFIFVLNPDTFPAPDALAELLERMRSDPSIGIAEARQIPSEHPKSYDELTGDTSWASGACMLQRRSAFEMVGGYDDEHYFLHVDDVDLSWRTRLGGWRTVYVPRAVVFHDKPLSPDGRPLSGATEAYWGLLGRLMLATRFGRPDVVEETLQTVERSGTDQQRAAAAEFARRRAEQRIPLELPGAETVAAFSAYEYGSRRW